MAGEGDILGGAASGAAAGSTFGPVGTVIGGVIGAIGGLFKSKSKKKLKQARKEEQAMTMREQAIQRRDLIRQAYIARATSVAASVAEEGGLESSAPLGAAASITSQTTGNLNYFDQQITSQGKVISLIGKAEKYASISSMISGGLDAGFSLYGAFKRPPPPRVDLVTASSIYKPNVGYNS